MSPPEFSVAATGSPPVVETLIAPPRRRRRSAGRWRSADAGPERHRPACDLQFGVAPVLNPRHSVRIPRTCSIEVNPELPEMRPLVEERSAVHDEAIRTFLLHDHGRVVRAVAAVCGDRERAEDAVQDALVDVWTKNRRVDDLTGWVTIVAINRARSRWRTQAAERRAFDRLAVEATSRPRSDGVDGGSSPVLFDAHLAEALRDLPRSQRSVVALHYLLDMSVADVAARLGIAEGTVKTHLHRARKTMRTALQTSDQDTTASDVGEVRHA